MNRISRPMNSIRGSTNSIGGSEIRQALQQFKNRSINFLVLREDGDSIIVMDRLSQMRFRVSMSVSER